MRLLLGIESMNELLQFHMLGKNGRIAPGQNHAPPCDWNGVQCEENLIVKIDWSYDLRVEISSLCWLPSTVRTLDVAHTYINNSLETRLLPKQLVWCNLVSCGISGTLELRTLPPQMKRLELQQNKLKGEVRLTHLPTTMEYIDLSKTKISVVVVSNESLPYFLESIRMYRMKHSVRLICLDDACADGRVDISRKDKSEEAPIPLYACTRSDYEAGRYEYY